MTLNLSMPGQDELKPRITVFGVGGAGGNAVNNMIEKQLETTPLLLQLPLPQAQLQTRPSETSVATFPPLHSSPLAAAPVAALKVVRPYCCS